jgi:hypothetical protein
MNLNKFITIFFLGFLGLFPQPSLTNMKAASVPIIFVTGVVLMKAHEADSIMSNRQTDKNRTAQEWSAERRHESDVCCKLSTKLKDETLSKKDRHYYTQKAIEKEQKYFNKYGQRSPSDTLLSVIQHEIEPAQKRETERLREKLTWGNISKQEKKQLRREIMWVEWECHKEIMKSYRTTYK